MSFGVVVPLKPVGRAKSRLAALGDFVRRELAVAFAADTVTAALECPLVGAVLVVTDDAQLARSLAGLGVDVVPDGSDDLNDSIRQAAFELERRHPGLRPAALLADLPALTSDDLGRALAAADAIGEELAYVPDADDAGTTLVVGTAGSPLITRFGPGSQRAHRESGATAIGLDLPRLRRDVDSPEDLAAARKLGLGARTSYVLTVHGL